MALEISSIKNEKLQLIARLADRNQDGKLKKDEYSLFAKAAQAQGVDSKSINEALDMNGIQRWWYDVDKISSDGKDDGKLSFKEGATSFVKGLLGGIPKAIIKHPIASVLTMGVCAGLTALTGGAILPVLTAIGLATGVGMAGVGTYKAIKAKTDGDAKQALETMGMGVTTTVMSMLSAGKALSKAEQAGVKSAHVAEDANIFQKIGQIFKAIPESLTKSIEWTRFNLGIPVMKIRNDKGFVVEKRYGEDSYRQYKRKYVYASNNSQSDYGLSVKKLPNGTIKTYDHTYSRPRILKEECPDGAYKIYNRTWEGKVLEEKTADGTIRKYSQYHSDNFRLLKETYANGGYKHFDKKGNVIEELVVTDKQKSYYENGKLLKETFKDGTYKKYSSTTKGRVIEETLPDGTRIDRYIKYHGVEGDFTKTTLNDGTYRVVDATTGKLFEERLADGTVKAYYSRYNGIEGDLTVVTQNGKEVVFDSSTGKILEGSICDGDKTSFYRKGKLINEKFSDGGYKYYDSDEVCTNAKIIEGDKTSFFENGKLSREEFSDGGYKYYDSDGVCTNAKIIEGDKTSFYRNGKLIKERFSDGGFKHYNSRGVCTEAKIIEGDKTSFFENGKLIKEEFSNGGFKYYDSNGVITDGYIIEGNKATSYKNGKLIWVREDLPDGGCKIYKDGILVEEKSGAEIARELRAASIARSIVKGSSSGSSSSSSSPSSSSLSSSKSSPTSGSSSSYDPMVGADYNSKDYYYKKNYGITYEQMLSMEDG